MPGCWSCRAGEWRSVSPPPSRDIDIPPALVDALDRDPDAGVTVACEQVLALEESGAFDGVHLIPVTVTRLFLLEVGAGARGRGR